MALLPTGWTRGVLFQPSGDLLTSSRESGLKRWPIRPVPGSAGTYRVGPPEPLLAGQTERVAQSGDGRTVAATQQEGARVLDLKRPAAPGPLLPHTGAVSVAISPDGRWIVTGTRDQTGIKVWSTSDHKPGPELPITGGATAAFSPDGRWLATVEVGECRLWNVATWEPGIRIPSYGRAVAFTPDSQLLAVQTDCNFIALLDPSTGKELTTLESPDQDRHGWMGFSPDGTRLVTTNNDSASVHIWDLRRLREGLAALGLDWARPAYPEARPSAAGALVQLQIAEK
jgi:WD40 repeat protein